VVLSAGFRIVSALANQNTIKKEEKLVNGRGFAQKDCAGAELAIRSYSGLKQSKNN